MKSLLIKLQDGREILRYTSKPFSTHTYVFKSKMDNWFMIDPGVETDLILIDLADRGIKKINRIICTHGHFDHVFGCYSASNFFKITPEIHLMEKKNLSTINFQLLICGAKEKYVSTTFHFFELSDHLDIDGVLFIHVPGHTPGSCSLLIDNLLFTGDTLYIDNIPESNLPGSCGDLLEKSKSKLINFIDDSVIILPGHGKFGVKSELMFYD